MSNYRSYVGFGYFYDPENSGQIEGWSKMFRVVEPTTAEGNRANRSLTEIKALIRDSKTNSTERALKLLEVFAKSPESAAVGYLAQARCLVGAALMQEDRWVEYVGELKKLRQTPPEWMSAAGIALELGHAYYRGGDYDNAISVMSAIAEQNPVAKEMLNIAKVQRDQLRKKECPGKDAGVSTAPSPTGKLENNGEMPGPPR